MMSLLVVSAFDLGAPPDTSLSGYVVLAAAALGLVANTIAVVGVAIRIGGMLGEIRKTGEQMVSEVASLRQTRDEHIGVLGRVVAQLDALEGRVTRGGL